MLKDLHSKKQDERGISSGEKMPEIVTESLRKIANGSAIIFMGTIISLSLGFFTRIIIVRFTTQNEFGIYSLALTIITICGTLAMFGLQEGVTRNIAYFRGKKEKENVQGTIYSAIIISLAASFLVTFIVISSSSYIATEIFEISEISPILKILSMSIPFTVITNVLISIFRGFDNANIKVGFDNILRPATYLLLLGTVVVLQMSFIIILYTYVISILITFVIIVIYFLKNKPNKIKYNRLHINKNTKELLRYSLPLLAVSILLMVMSWTDTLMLGYFKTTEIVGVYSATYPVAALLSTGINSLGYLYVPIISGLYSKNQVKELGKINENSTKWSFVTTVPIFSLIFIFPEFVLNTFYDYRYIEASNVLQVLALGFMMNSFFGLNYFTLMATGKTTFLMTCSSISAALNILLNLILIPTYGMIGAAVASTISFTAIEMYMTLKLYKFLKIHPFNNKYKRIVLLSALLIGIFCIFRISVIQTFWTILGYYFLFLVTYLILILLTKSLDKEDIQMLQDIKKAIMNPYLTFRSKIS